MNYQMLGAEVLIDESGNVTYIGPSKFGPGAQYAPTATAKPLPVAPQTEIRTYNGTLQDLQSEMEYVIKTETAERLPYIADVLRRKAEQEKRPNIAVEMMVWADRLDAAAKEKSQEDPNREAAMAEPQAAPVVPKSTNLLPMAVAGAVALIALK